MVIWLFNWKFSNLLINEQLLNILDLYLIVIFHVTWFLTMIHHIVSCLLIFSLSENFCTWMSFVIVLAFRNVITINICCFFYRNLLKGKRCLNFVEVFLHSKRRMHFWKLFQRIRWKGNKWCSLWFLIYCYFPSMVLLSFTKKSQEKKRL